jgi:hypothetical protein
MSPRDVAPIELDPETAGALATVHEWGQVFNRRQLDRLLELSTPDIQLLTRNRSAQGHDSVRRLMHLQSYGVAQHVRARRYIARGATVIVEALIELRWVDSGELAETMHGAAVFDVRDGRISRFRPQPDLACAFGAAGWPPAAVPTGPNPAAPGHRGEHTDSSLTESSRHKAAYRGAST